MGLHFLGSVENFIPCATIVVTFSWSQQQNLLDLSKLKYPHNSLCVVGAVLLIVKGGS